MTGTTTQKLLRVWDTLVSIGVDFGLPKEASQALVAYNGYRAVRGVL